MKTPGHGNGATLTVGYISIILWTWTKLGKHGAKFGILFELEKDCNKKIGEEFIPKLSWPMLGRRNSTSLTKAKDTCCKS